jgi:hypothetical protein
LALGWVVFRCETWFFPLLSRFSGNSGDNLAANLFLATSPVTHDATAGGHNGNAKSAKRLRKIGCLSVDSPPGLRLAGDFSDHALSSIAVPQANINRALATIFDDIEAIDESFIFQHFRHTTVELVVQALHRGGMVPDCIPDSRQHVGCQVLL